MSKRQIQVFALPKDTMTDTVPPVGECLAWACAYTLWAHGIFSRLEADIDPFL